MDVKARQIFRPAEDRCASGSQINKLLVMLSKQELIWSQWDKEEREWDYDEQDAVKWVREHMAFDIHVLTQLTHSQIQACYEELGE